MNIIGVSTISNTMKIDINSENTLETILSASTDSHQIGTLSTLNSSIKLSNEKGRSHYFFMAPAQSSDRRRYMGYIVD